MGGLAAGAELCCDGRMQTRVARFGLVVLSFLGGGLLAGAALAGKPPLSPKQAAFESTIVAEMSQVNAEGARAFTEASEARERGDLRLALRAFDDFLIFGVEEVLTGAPVKILAAVPGSN